MNVFWIILTFNLSTRGLKAEGSFSAGLKSLRSASILNNKVVQLLYFVVYLMSINAYYFLILKIKLALLLWFSLLKINTNSFTQEVFPSCNFLLLSCQCSFSSKATKYIIQQNIKKILAFVENYIIKFFVRIHPHD